MTTNRPEFRMGVALCAAGVFVVLFSASVSGANMASAEAKHRTVYSLEELVAGKFYAAGMKGRMKMLVPDPGTDATDFVSIYQQMIDSGMDVDAWDFGVVAAFTPSASYANVRYHIDGGDLITATEMAREGTPKHLTIVYPWGNEAFTSGKVEPFVALGSKAQIGGGEIAYRFVDSYFSIAGDEPTLTLEGTPISMQLAMIEDKYAASHWADLLKWVSDSDTSSPAPKDDEHGPTASEEKQPQEVIDCFRAYKPWSECYSMMAFEDGALPAYVGDGFKGFYADVFKPDETTVHSIWVPSPAELLTSPSD